MAEISILEQVQREYELHLQVAREKFRNDLRNFLSRMMDTVVALSHEVDELPSNEAAPVIYRALSALQSDFHRVWDLYCSYLLESREEEAR